MPVSEVEVPSRKRYREVRYFLLALGMSNPTIPVSADMLSIGHPSYPQSSKDERRVPTAEIVSSTLAGGTCTTT